MIRTVVLGTASGLLLAACATAGPRLEELGPNSYMVTVEAEETPDGKKMARRVAQAQAEQHCQSIGQYARSTHMTSGVSDFMQGGEVELNFRCQAEPYRGP